MAKPHAPPTVHCMISPVHFQRSGHVGDGVTWGCHAAAASCVLCMYVSALLRFSYRGHSHSLVRWIAGLPALLSLQRAWLATLKRIHRRQCPRKATVTLVMRAHTVPAAWCCSNPGLLTRHSYIVLPLHTPDPQQKPHGFTPPEIPLLPTPTTACSCGKLCGAALVHTHTLLPLPA